MRWRQLLTTVRITGAALLDLALPWSCLACDGIDPPGEGVAAVNRRCSSLCSSCNSAISWRDGARSPLEVGHALFRSVVVAARYEPPVDELVARLKYGGERLAAVPLAEIIATAVADHGAPFRVDGLVVVPMHPWKRWVRGLDHAGELTAELAPRLRLPIVQGLRRTRLTAAQGGARSLQERSLHVRDAFAARRRAVRGRDLALVDDVVTSGATASECARALLAAGARSVSLLAAAGNG